MPKAISLDKRYSTTKVLFLNEEVASPQNNKSATPKRAHTRNGGGLRVKGYTKLSQKNMPLITIITVVLNNEEGLEKTIKSVLAQPYNNVEYLVIDGSSTDRSLKVIQQYNNQIDYWISEKDDGIYYAMNKGIALAKGDGLLFLNAGDYFVGKVIDSAMQIPCFIPVKYINDKQYIRRKITSEKIEIPNCHQGIIFENKNIYYDTKFLISSDYDFFLRHGYDRKMPLVETEGYVHFDITGRSSSSSELALKECQLISRKKFGISLMYIRQYLVVNYKILRQKIRRRYFPQRK